MSALARPLAALAAAERDDPIAELERLEDCRRLLTLGARPCIAAHAAEVPIGRAVRLYRSLFGRRAPRGMLPCSSEWYFQTRRRRIEASCFAAIHLRLYPLNARLSRARLLIASWSAYARGRDGPLISVDRAWLLLRLMDAGEILVVRCGSCAARQAVLRGEPLPVIRCALCGEGG